MKPTKTLAILLLIAALAGICGPLSGQKMPPENPLDTLYPPTNFTGSAVENSSYLTWQKPQKPDGTTPAGLLGYYIYRLGTLIFYINNAETLFCYDYDLDPGTYVYTIKANYDLTYYGSPGQYGTSPAAGPITVVLATCCGLPFYEPWDQGTFTFNAWKFVPSQLNWSVQTSQGNPAPTAIFSGNPGLQNYEVTMRTLQHDATPWLCINMYLEFDYQLADLTSSGTEKLTAGYIMDSVWYPVFEISNTGSTGWIHQKIDISQVYGNVFKTGFMASGANSTNFEKWSVDNIMVYGVCKGPVDCDYSRSGHTVHVFWQPPDCDSLQGLTGYNVYRSQWVPSSFAKLNASPITSLEYFDNLPVNDTCTKYYYYITALHQDPVTHILLCEAPCDTMLVDLSLGIETADNNGTRVFPNPANDRLTIQSDSPVRSAELLDFTGQRMLFLDGCMKMEFTMPVTAIPSGIYLIRIKNRTGTILKKVSVIH